MHVAADGVGMSTKAVNYVALNDDALKVKVSKVDKSTTIKSSIYGPILVTEGNYILQYVNGPQRGQKVGMTETDLNMLYKPEKQ